MVKISAGCYDLNKWLHGGYESDIITVIYGGPGTGKTNFCLLAAVSQAKKDKKVIYIDTEGGFSIERLKQINQNDYEKVISNILLLNPVNFNEQRAIFQDLYKHLKKEVSLIIVDSMAILYRIDLAEAREKSSMDVQKTNSTLATQMKSLSEIARKKNIPVIVTNQIYKWEDYDKMVGGDILKYWGKCLIELTNEKGRRTANLRKHRSLGESKLDFVIENEGIRKKGFL